MKHRDYFMLPNEVFSLKLKPRDLAVLACLIRHKDNENNSCFPSRKLISDECCIDTRTVDAALSELEKRSPIIKKRRLRQNGSYTSNMYFVADIFALTQSRTDTQSKGPEIRPVSGFQDVVGNVPDPETNADTGECGRIRGQEKIALPQRSR